MRPLALVSGSIIALAAAAGRVDLPPALTKDFAALAAAPSLTVVYTVMPTGGSPAPYRLVLSRPGAFRLTTPTGFVVGDGATVTTYSSLTKKYSQEPYTEAWAASFAGRPEVMPWAAFLLKSPADDIVSASSGTPRKIGAYDTDTVHIATKKLPKADLFLDKKLGVARAAIYGPAPNETLVQAKTIEIGRAPMDAKEFAFVAPAGATKEEPAVAFAQVKVLIDDRCMPCHSVERHSHGINLGTYEGVVATVVPGNPAGSLLIKSVKGDGVRLMPLGNHPKLTEDEIKVWSDWIAAGAKKG